MSLASNPIIQYTFAQNTIFGNTVVNVVPQISNLPLINPNFTIPSVPVDGYNYLVTFTGWVIGTNTGQRGAGIANGYNGPWARTLIPGGLSQYLFLQLGAPGQISLYQTITFPAGNYTLSFYIIGRRYGYQSSNTLTISVGSQTILSNYFYPYTTSSSSNWTITSAPVNLNYQVICCDSSGQHVTVGCSYNYIYNSSDYGTTWTAVLSVSANWKGCCCSSSGQYVAVVSDSGNGIYYSSNYGAVNTWTQIEPGNHGWNSIACTGDGLTFFACSGDGTVVSYKNGSFTSIVHNLSAQNFKAICCDLTGTYLAICAFGDYIYNSTNGGTTWTQTSSPNALWLYITCDGTGKYIYASIYNAQIYNSYSATYNFTTWTTNLSIGATTSVYANTSNTLILASGSAFGLYASTDQGATWNKVEGYPITVYGFSASCDDYNGSTIYSAISNDAHVGVYKGTLTTSGTDPWPWITKSIPFTVATGGNYNLNFLSVSPTNFDTSFLITGITITY
jgi:hypothetical protein